MRALFVRASLGLVLLLFVLAFSVPAQQLATLNVTVNDQSGAGVPGATLTLKNKDTGAVRTATTGEGGLAVVADIPAGLYDLTAEHSGLAPQDDFGVLTRKDAKLQSQWLRVR